jgi:hypothetical protein
MLNVKSCFPPELRRHYRQQQHQQPLEDTSLDTTEVISILETKTNELKKALQSRQRQINKINFMEYVNKIYHYYHTFNLAQKHALVVSFLIPKLCNSNQILLRSIQLTLVQGYWGSTVKMLFSHKFLLFMRPIHLCAPERLTSFGARTFLVLSQQ